MLLLHVSPLLLISMPGGSEWLVILIVALLLFGGRKIPELMRGLGKGIREFNDAKSSVTRELEEGMKEKENVNNTHSSVNGTPSSMNTTPSSTTTTSRP